MLVSFIDLTIYYSRCLCIHTHIYINNPHHTTILSQNKSTKNNNKNQSRILVFLRVTFYWEIQLILKIKTQKVMDFKAGKMYYEELISKKNRVIGMISLLV